jgi:hypothetical protein
MKKRFVYGLGFCFFPTKNSFREKKMFDSSLNTVFADLKLPKTITPSQETDMC